MEPTPKQQAVDLIREAKNILIVSHKSPDGDSLGSALALKIAFEKLGKKVVVASPDEPGKIFSYLPGIDQVVTDVKVNSDFIISIDLRTTDFEKLGYKRDKENDRLEIVVTPKEGEFKKEDVEVKPADAKYDLIIALDTPNLERLGALAQPADLFYETAVINIDHHPSNEKFGKVNWIELVATSTAEILVSLLEAISQDQQLIGEDVATALLTGLIYDTSSFQNVNTTPKSLTVAAQLVAAGARQQEIVKNLYKTKSLETLRLWGLILSQVKEDKIHRFLWSAVRSGEIERIGADESALSGVVDELLKSANDVDFAMLLSEREGQVHGSLRAIAKGFDVSQIAEMFGGGGHESAAAFRTDGQLDGREDEILSKIREFQNRMNGNEVKENLPEQKESIKDPANVEARSEKTEKEESVSDEPKAELSEEKNSSEGQSFKTKW
jgi:phosphoesterase RecJ-like protein